MKVIFIMDAESTKTPSSHHGQTRWFALVLGAPPQSAENLAKSFPTASKAMTRQSVWHGLRKRVRIMPRLRLHSLSHHFTTPEADEPRAVILARRARKHRLRGEGRQAMVTLQEACFLSDQDARLWALYGASCRRMRRYDDAARAFRQAIFLRARRQEHRRVQVLRGLLSALKMTNAA